MFDNVMSGGSPVPLELSKLHHKSDCIPPTLDITHGLENNSNGKRSSQKRKERLEVKIKSEPEPDSNPGGSEYPVTPTSLPGTPTNELPSSMDYPGMNIPGASVAQMLPWLPFYSPEKLLQMPNPWLSMWPKMLSSEMQSNVVSQSNYMSALSNDILKAANRESEKNIQCHRKAEEIQKDRNISKSGISDPYGNNSHSGISLSSGSSKRKRKLPIHYKRVSHIKEEPDEPDGDNNYTYPDGINEDSLYPDGLNSLHEDSHHNRTRYYYPDVNMDIKHRRSICVNPDSRFGSHFERSTQVVMPMSRSKSGSGKGQGHGLGSEVSLDDLTHLSPRSEVMDLSVSHPSRSSTFQGDNKKLITPPYTTTSYMPPSPGSDSESTKSIEPQPKTTICYRPTSDDIKDKSRDSRDAADIGDSRERARESALDLIRRIQSEVKDSIKEQSNGGKFYGKVIKNEPSNVPNVTIGPTNSYNLDMFRKFAKSNRDGKVDTAFLPTCDGVLGNHGNGPVHNAESSAAWLQWMMASSQPQKEASGPGPQEVKEPGSLYVESSGCNNRYANFIHCIKNLFQFLLIFAHSQIKSNQAYRHSYDTDGKL